MTKKVRIENADTSNHKVRVHVENKDESGNWVRRAPDAATPIDYACMQTEQWIHSGQRIVIEEA